MKVLFAGSFDPFTTGHRAIVERALRMFDGVVVGIGNNERKTGMWSVADRVKAIRTAFAGYHNVNVESYDGLTVDFAKQCGAGALLRGIRSVSDFEAERNLADTNMAIAGIDTVFIVAEPKYSFVSSSMVRELIHHGYDARKYLGADFMVP